MKKLSRQMEEVGKRVLLFLHHHSSKNSLPENGSPEEQERTGKVCYIQKHGRKMSSEESENSLRYDVIRMLIKGSEFPHALSLHVLNGTTDFHVYSKKGWVSFTPHQNSIVVTVGDKLQVIFWYIIQLLLLVLFFMRFLRSSNISWNRKLVWIIELVRIVGQIWEKVGLKIRILISFMKG